MNLKLSKMESLKERWNAKTPRFWKRVQRIAIIAGTVAGIIIAAPVTLPAAVVTAAGYIVAVGTAVATTAQLTKEDNPETK
jgi:dolichol kinase